ncbi:NAD(P)-dependent oxidoreductase [Pseudomonas sp. R5(2019)]|uniref:NAD(P)-dependent oxidoreductase n=1 Tax=Pseudomonas sp. R5(2019) TaxID=2697566 RepID=UPI0014122529|nr:NAD(P)H-binding protein [Pseudomonas sp. R5(2019)]NBA96995.1 NAD(P)H-binding protein [Pseudomonas sp. R5(2019)]
MKNAETPVMKLLIYGAMSSLGGALMAEFLRRQHEVIVILDDLNALAPRPGLRTKTGGLGDAEQVLQSVAGCSAVLCLLGAVAPNDPQAQLQITQALVGGLQRANIRRLILIGDFAVLDSAGPDQAEQLRKAEQIVDLLQRSPLHWTLVNAPHSVAGLTIEHFHPISDSLEPGVKESVRTLAGVAAGIADELSLNLHLGEHINFVS